MCFAPLGPIRSATRLRARVRPASQSSSCTPGCAFRERDKFVSAPPSSLFTRVPTEHDFASTWVCRLPALVRHPMNPAAGYRDFLRRPGLHRERVTVDVWPSGPGSSQSRDSASTVAYGGASSYAPVTRYSRSSSCETGWVAETRWPPSFKRGTHRCCYRHRINRRYSTFSRRIFSTALPDSQSIGWLRWS